jgi:glucokinase
LIERQYNVRMLLGGDIGGTKTLLGLFERDDVRPRPLHVDEFTTLDYDGLEAILGTFLERHRISTTAIEAASFGVAGAITDQVAQLTNVPWRIDAAALMRHSDFRRVRLLNDLEAMAYAIPVLTGDEIAVLQEGTRVASGNVAVIAAGTGLGEGMLLNIEGRLVPGQSEGGHADFAARTPRELEMVAALTRVYGRVSAEHILSGPGLVNVYRFTHGTLGSEPAADDDELGAPARSRVPPACPAVGQVSDSSELPARITASALAGTCAQCVEALEMFVSAYGAEAGNMGLRVVATYGVYIGGGIAPRILPALADGRFMAAFRNKAPQDGLVARMPVAVILNPKSALLGAAIHANLNS